MRAYNKVRKIYKEDADDIVRFVESQLKKLHAFGGVHSHPFPQEQINEYSDEMILRWLTQHRPETEEQCS